MADQWNLDYEAAKDFANDSLSLIQERNLKHPGGGPEASRTTAAVRRKLGTLGTLLDNLRTALESPDCANITENEKNRRRDLLSSLRSRREQMLQALKRGQPRSSRSALLDQQSGGDGGGGSALQPLGRETDATAELDNRGLVSMQQQIMHQQDTELEHLERSVTTTKHVALQINEETSLHNRLLDELDLEVGSTQNRLSTAQKKLKNVMRRAGSCKTQLLVFLMVVVLVLVILIGFKILIHL
ncbi:hypothetical protein Ndes2526B_g08947 [Nannochloris sp. 'desiccata']